MKNIISHTERCLSTATVPAEVLSQLYQKFVSENNIPHHEVEPTLKPLLSANLNFPSSAQTSHGPPNDAEKPSNKTKPK